MLSRIPRPYNSKVKAFLQESTIESSQESYMRKQYAAFDGKFSPTVTEDRMLRHLGYTFNGLDARNVLRTEK